MAEGAGFENRCGVRVTVGSNPTLSAFCFFLGVNAPSQFRARSLKGALGRTNADRQGYQNHPLLRSRFGAWSEPSEREGRQYCRLATSTARCLTQLSHDLLGSVSLHRRIFPGQSRVRFSRLRGSGLQEGLARLDQANARRCLSPLPPSPRRDPGWFGRRRPNRPAPQRSGWRRMRVPCRSAGLPARRSRRKPWSCR